MLVHGTLVDDDETIVLPRVVVASRRSNDDDDDDDVVKARAKNAPPPLDLLDIVNKACVMMVVTMMCDTHDNDKTFFRCIIP
jgi:hypothetical protein